LARGSAADVEIAGIALQDHVRQFIDGRKRPFAARIPPLDSKRNTGRITIHYESDRL
jgi:hypothetical protein